MKKNFVQYLDFFPVNLCLISTFYPEQGNDYAWIVFRCANGDKIRWVFEPSERGGMMNVYRQLLKDMLK